MTHAGALEGQGRDEDQLAFLRREPEFRNLTIVELPNGDFGQTILRNFLVAAWQADPDKAQGLDGALKTLKDAPFGPFLLTLVAAGIAAYGVYSFARSRYARV